VDRSIQHASEENVAADLSKQSKIGISFAFLDCQIRKKFYKASAINFVDMPAEIEEESVGRFKIEQNQFFVNHLNNINNRFK